MTKSYNQYCYDVPSAEDVDEVVCQVELEMADKKRSPENIAAFTEEVLKRLQEKIAFELIK